MNTLTHKGGEGGVPAQQPQKPALAWENPLIPNKKLRALYTAMAELRLLEARLGKRHRPPPGEEGVRAGTILNLTPKDLTSDPPFTLATTYLHGIGLPDLIADTRGASRPRRSLPKPLSPRQLPALPDPADRVHLALGAAFVLKPRRDSIVLAYLYTADLNPAQWTTLLSAAAQHTLPLFFVILPHRQRTQGLSAPGRLALLAGTHGVPGIPVDAEDPVALYRVAQEATLRIRSGGGPVLMESIPFRTKGSKQPIADPLKTMRQFLVHRGIVDERWLNLVDSRFRARLEASAR